jgi:hypothetical protein
MTNAAIKEIVEHFKEKDMEVRVRDIAFILLSKMFSDPVTAYQCLFGTEGYDEYVESPKKSELENYLTDKGYIRSIITGSDEGITFEENKRAMEQLLVDVQRSLDDGLIEPKDAYARMADIRTKLNDKFKVESAKKDRLIVVEKKYNHICERYNCECYLPTVEDLKEMYNLVEKQ